jgi:hypothetical protein
VAIQFPLGSNECLEPKFRTSAGVSFAGIIIEEKNDSSSAAPLFETSHDDRKLDSLADIPQWILWILAKILYA